MGILLQGGLDKVLTLPIALRALSRTKTGPTTLLLDHFTDADSTQLPSHTMDTGPGWTQLEGLALHSTILSNRASLGTTAPDSVSANASAADITASLIVNLATVDGLHGIGIIIRCTDASNYWLAWFAGDNTWTLYEFNAGSFTSRASSAFTITGSTDYTLQVVASGTTITATINGGTSISYASATFNQTATICGIRGYSVGGTTPRGDDFQVTTP